MNEKLARALSRSKQPILISASSEAADGVVLNLFSTEGGILIASVANENGKAFSPIDGSEMELVSVGEIAAESSDLAELVKIGHSEKSGLDILTSAEIAKAIEEGSTIYCSACGEPVKVVKAEGEEDEPESESEDDTDSEEEDDEPLSDEEDDSDSEDDEPLDEDDVTDDEEEVDPSASDEEEDPEEASVSIDELLASIDAEIAAEEDEEDEVDDEGDVEEEVVDDEDPGLAMGSTSIKQPLHKLAGDLTKASVVFLNRDSAMLMVDTASGKMQVGNFSSEKLSDENASAGIMSKPDLFGKAVSTVLSTTDSDSMVEKLSPLGFTPVEVEMPMNVAQEEMVKKAVDSAKSEATASMTSSVKEIADNFNKLVALASVGISKNVLEGNSLYPELAELLKSVGVKTPDKVARKFMEEAGTKFFASVVKSATELAAKDPSYVQGISAAVEKASYPELASDKIDTPVSTAVLGNDRVVIASSYERTPKAQNNVKSVLARLGRSR